MASIMEMMPRITVPLSSIADYLPIRRRRGLSPYAAAGIAGAGVALGLGVGVLLAPQAGRDLRGNIAHRARTVTKEVGGRVGQAVRRLGEGQRNGAGARSSATAATSA